MKKKNYNLMIGTAMTLFFLVFAIVGQFWTPYSTTAMNPMAVDQAPSLAHLMGTDNFGRDIFSRVMNGCGSTFIVAVSTVAIGLTFGTIIGAVTGYYGGWLDNVIMRINDMILSFPSILLALIIISIMGPGQYNIIIALGILFIPSFARIVRSEMIRCRDLDFVRSAKIMGASDFRIIFVHILPNARVSILTAATIGFNNAVLSEASMSYLGLGIQPPEPSLGRMLSEAQSFLMNTPWYPIALGITIILIILGFSMVSEGLRSLQE